MFKRSPASFFITPCVIGLVSVLVAAGCGSSSKSPSPDSATEPAVDAAPVGQTPDGGPADADVFSLIKQSDALVIPAVGPKLAPELFEGAKLKLVQVTGAGVDRLDQAALTRLGIPVANVAGGSNSAVAEYAVTTASALLRRFAWADAEIKAGNYAKFRGRMIADNLAGIEGLTVGLVGFGTIGRAVAQVFHRMGAKLCFFDPAGDAAFAKSLDAKSIALDERNLTAVCGLSRQLKITVRDHNICLGKYPNPKEPPAEAQKCGKAP